MSEASYWEEYDVIHNNKGKSPKEVEKKLRLLEESKRKTELDNRKKK